MEIIYKGVTSLSQAYRKEKYAELCKIEKSIPIFSRDWWLDAVCGAENWDVIIIDVDGQIIASMPYAIKVKNGFRFISQPILTQTLGPWIRDFNSKYSTKLANEKKIFSTLIDELPDYDKFHQHWHFKNTNWLPFFWKGFSQTTRVTYRLKSLEDIEVVYNSFSGNIRREIKKAIRHKITIDDSPDIDDFIALNKLVFSRQGIKTPYDEAQVKLIHEACQRHQNSRIFIARDTEGKCHAGIYLIWDEMSAYYLMGGGDPELRASGATSLCMWEAIKFASTVTSSFDFEGTMLESVERYFRAFGARQVQYHSVSKLNSRTLKLIDALKLVVS